MGTETTTRPIIFSGEMVQAILGGRKTQTRRVWKKPRGHTNHDVYPRYIGGRFELSSNGFCIGESINCPYGKIGDRLWVREKHNIECPYPAEEKCGHPDHVYYWATEEPVVRESFSTPWRPSIFMPRWASRITLEITGVRVERVQDITPKDAKSEGVPAPQSEVALGLPDQYALHRFKHLWDSINAKRGYGWDANPWVWVVEFQRQGE